MVESWYTTIDELADGGLLEDAAGDQIFYYLSQMEKWQAPAPKVSVCPIVPSFEDGPQIDCQAVKAEWEGEDEQGTWRVEMILHANGTITNFVFAHFRLDGEDLLVASHKTHPYTEGMVLLMRWLPIKIKRK